MVANSILPPLDYSCLMSRPHSQRRTSQNIICNKIWWFHMYCLRFEPHANKYCIQTISSNKRTIDVSFEIECTCDNSFDKCGSIHNYMLINRREDFMLHAKHIFIIIRETMCLCYSTAYTHFHENLKCRRIRFSLYSLDWIFMLKQFLSEFMMYDKIDSKPKDGETSDWAAENERFIPIDSQFALKQHFIIPVKYNEMVTWAS